MESVISRTKHLIRIDPRTKILLLFVSGTVIFIRNAKEIESFLFLMSFILLVLGKQYKAAAKFCIVFFTMMLLDIFMSPHLTGMIGTAFFTFIRLPRMMIPMIMSAALLMKTTTVSEFIAAFKKMHITEKIIIPFSVMFRFIPTLREEWTSIGNAMQFRGIGLSVKNVVTKPMMTLEYVLVPLLMSTATISNELAAASLSRGLDSDGTRSCIASIRLRLIDYIIIIGCIGVLVYAHGGNK